MQSPPRSSLCNASATAVTVARLCISPRSLSNLLQKVRFLERNRFIDEATRALFVELLLHSPNTNLVTHVRFLLEFDSSGIIYPSARISVIEPDMYVSTLHQFRAFWESTPPLRTSARLFLFRCAHARPPQSFALHSCCGLQQTRCTSSGT